MAENAEQFSELSGRIGTKNGTETDNTGASILQRWKQLIKTPASRVLGVKLILNSVQQSSKIVG